MGETDAPGALRLALLGWYVPIKHGHVALVAASGALFAARGAGVLGGARWPMAAGVRWTSVAVDTLLLAAGVALWAMLGLNPARDAWLGTKLALVAGYIGVGSVALKRGRTPRSRTLAFVVAVALYAAVVGVALAHHPLGWWARG